MSATHLLAEEATVAGRATMRALVYHGPGRKSWEERPRPVLVRPGDAIVRVSTTTICGTDLHILKGDVPTVADGRILGHEAVGYVEEIGTAVQRHKKGDRVLVSCISSCGICDFCKRGMPSHCRDGGWILGHLIDGTQAEYVRIPHAETSLYPLPAEADGVACVMLSDIFPTGFECGVRNGQVKPGDSVAIVGAGPIGLAALLTAQLYSPSMIVTVDPDANRLDTARRLGAEATVSERGEAAVAKVLSLTQGAGVDVAIEAVGVPASFEVCQAVVAPGGHIANVGVHGRSVELHLEKLWAHNVTITTGLVDTTSTPMLLRMLLAGRLSPKALVTHRFGLGDILKAYETFANAAAEKALKVVIAAS
jgi:alcohol dehydrogenase